MDLVRANAFERTFEIDTSLDRGTAFTIDRGDRQYLVTARHLLPPDDPTPEVTASIRLRRDSMRLSLLPVRPPQADAAVAPLDEALTIGDLPLPADGDGLVWSQQMYFLGYPYGLATNINSADSGERIPFVKSGIWSAVATVDGIYTIYLDGHNNPGSGGVVATGCPAVQRCDP